MGKLNPILAMVGGVVAGYMIVTLLILAAM